MAIKARVIEHGPVVAHQIRSSSAEAEVIDSESVEARAPTQPTPVAAPRKMTPAEAGVRDYVYIIGPPGPPGPPGPSGGGGALPSGGYVGDVLIKSGEDSAEWVTPASDAEEDNTRPITAAAVYTEIGNINALLATI